MPQTANIPHVTSFDLAKAITFSRIFNKVKLSPSARLVLRCLVDFWNPAKGLVYPGQKIVAECTGATRRSVNSAIDELRKEGLIITSGSAGEKLKYYFTEKFFTTLKISQGREKISYGGREKIAHHEQHETRTNKKQSASHISNLSSYVKKKNSYYQSEGIQYKSPEATRDDLKVKNDIKRCSPMDDYQTAVNWLAELTGEEFKHSFIKTRVNEVKRKWNL